MNKRVFGAVNKKETTLVFVKIKKNKNKLRIFLSKRRFPHEISVKLFELRDLTFSLYACGHGSYKIRELHKKSLGPWWVPLMVAP